MYEYIVLKAIWVALKLELNINFWKGQEKVGCSATIIYGWAASWRLLIVQDNQVPEPWSDFGSYSANWILSFESERRDRDWLNTLRNDKSVENYIKKFRNIILTIPELRVGEKWDSFWMGLKPQVRFELMKAG